MTARPQIQNAHARTHTLPLNIFVVVVTIDFPTFVRLRDRPRAHALAYVPEFPQSRTYIAFHNETERIYSLQQRL